GEAGVKVLDLARLVEDRLRQGVIDLVVEQVALPLAPLEEHAESGSELVLGARLTVGQANLLLGRWRWDARAYGGPERPEGPRSTMKRRRARPSIPAPTIRKRAGDGNPSRCRGSGRKKGVRRSARWGRSAAAKSTKKRAPRAPPRLEPIETKNPAALEPRG